ncbi:hypothetical protein [Frateuria defendens]|uniref:hypothetical protein n=1 Tax=Frateuria defendens TaxID=2219559 RepID=UPI00129362C8|nr:hypothetical protein [Frateuria defendens]
MAGAVVLDLVQLRRRCSACALHEVNRKVVRILRPDRLAALCSSPASHGSKTG